MSKNTCPRAGVFQYVLIPMAYCGIPILPQYPALLGLGGFGCVINASSLIRVVDLIGKVLGIRRISKGCLLGDLPFLKEVEKARVHRDHALLR